MLLYTTELAIIITRAQEANTCSNGVVGKILAWGETDKRAGRVIGSVLLSAARAP